MRVYLVMFFALVLPMFATVSYAKPRSGTGVAVVENDIDQERFKRELERSLRNIFSDAKILSCEVVVRSDEPSGEDVIYGASCLVSTGTAKAVRLLMCDDTMVGKFTMTSAYFWGAPPLQTIGAFVRNNCPAGG
jgi:hypothetical protein